MAARKAIFQRNGMVGIGIMDPSGPSSVGGVP
jgi:hypothetical protein